MKKIVFFFIVGFVIFPVNSQPIQDWEFPIKPGTPEWRKLNTQSLKVQACQIPNDLLCNITTEKLVKLYLDYPLLINITAFSTFHAGIENLRNNFNGINELLSRNGSSELILEEYIKSNPNNIMNEWTEFQKGQFAFRIISLELILAQKEVLDKLSNQSILELLNISTERYYVKKESISVYENQSLKSCVYLIANLLLKLKFDQSLTVPREMEDLISFANSNSVCNDELMSKILLMAKELIAAQ